MNQKRKSSDYGQSWMLASALLDRDRNLTDLEEYFRVMARRFGIFFPFSDRERPMTRNHLERSLETLIKRAWLLRDADAYHLTDEGRGEAERMLADMERGNRFLKKATRPETVSKVTLIVHFLLAAVKLPAAFISGSVGLMNDALDTLRDGVSSLFVYFGVKRGKERLASRLLLLFMVATGLFTLYEAVCSFFKPEPLAADWIAFIALALSAGLCALLRLYQRYVGLKHACVPLIAQSIDSRNHIIVALGVSIGLVAAYFRFPLLDRIVGIAVAILILKGATELLVDLTHGGDERELDLSKYGFIHFDDKRQREMTNWFLYEINQGRAATRDELSRKIAASVDFGSIAPFVALGFDKGSAIEEKLNAALAAVFDRGLAIEAPQSDGESALKLTEAGKRELNRVLSGTWRFRRGNGAARKRGLVGKLAGLGLGALAGLASAAAAYIALRWIIGFLPPLELWGADALAERYMVRFTRPTFTVGPYSLSGAQLVCVFVGTVLIFIGRAIARPAKRLLHPVVRHNSDSPAYIVTEGPFAARRHPVYAGSILACVGAVIAAHSVYALLWSAVTAALRLAVSVHEERKLSANFGDEYEQYRTTVRRRFFPWWTWLLLAAAYVIAWAGLPRFFP